MLLNRCSVSDGTSFNRKKPQSDKKEKKKEDKEAEESGELRQD